MRHGSFKSMAGVSTRAMIITLAAISVAALAVAGFGWWGWSTRKAPAAALELPETTTAGDSNSVLLNVAQLRAQGVETAPIQEATAIPLGGLPAQIAASLSGSAQVVAPYGGVVTRVLVDEGSAVRQGQALALVQSKEVLAAKADLARARTDAAAASAQAQRDAALLAEGIIPASRNEQSQARSAASQATLQEAVGALARIRLVGEGQTGEYELLSPMSGHVVRRHLMPGQAIASLDRAFVVAEPGALDVSFWAPLRLRSDLRPGLTVRLPDGTIARVTAIGGDTDPDSQTLRVRARVDADQAQVRPYAAGERIDVTLLLPAPPGTLNVPASALLPAGSDHVLYVAEPVSPDKQGELRIRAVPVQLLGQDEAQSSSTVRVTRPDSTPPLAAGMQVVVRGTALLKSLIPPQ